LSFFRGDSLPGSLFSLVAVFFDRFHHNPVKLSGQRPGQLMTVDSAAFDDRLTLIA